MDLSLLYDSYDPIRIVYNIAFHITYDCDIVNCKCVHCKLYEITLRLSYNMQFIFRFLARNLC